MAEIISIPAHPKANSYITLEEAEEMFNIFSEWEVLDDNAKINTLILTAQKIDAIPYLGQKFYPTQGLAFPRKYDRRVMVRVLSFYGASETTILTSKGMLAFKQEEDEVLNYVYQSPDTYILDGFPKPSTIKITLFSGDTLIDDGAGNIVDSSGTILATVDYNKGIITGNLGETIVIKADYNNGKILVALDFKLSPDKYLDNCLKGAGLHIVTEKERDYYQVVSNNIFTGEIILDKRVKTNYLGKPLFFYPYPEDLKRAFIYQIKSELGIIEWEKFKYKGIKSVKIGDTARTYDTPKIAPKIDKIAGKYNVNPAIFGYIGKYTIYGKMESFIGDINV